jgi:hypothetical protein
MKLKTFHWLGIVRKISILLGHLVGATGWIAGMAPVLPMEKPGTLVTIQ